jgi:hypothetical protein
MVAMSDEETQVRSLLTKYENELRTTMSLLNHHRDESRKLEARMIELREITGGLYAFLRGINKQS